METKKLFMGLGLLSTLTPGIISSNTVIAEGGNSASLSSKFLKEILNTTGNVGKISAASIALSSIFGVISVPIIIAALARGSMGVRGLLLKFKLKKLLFVLEALAAKFWFNRSNYKGQFSNIPILYWYGNNCFINSAFYTFVAPENYEFYKKISTCNVDDVVKKINVAVGFEKWSKFEGAWNKLDENRKKKEAERIINIAKVCKNFLDIVNGNSSKNKDYMMDDKFSLVGKFKSWQLNEEDGSYKAEENKLLSQEGRKKLREDYDYGSSATVIERLGGYRKIFDFDSFNENDSKAKEKKTSNSFQNDSLNENGIKTKKEGLSTPQESSCNKSEENGFDNNGGFEVLNEVDEVNIVASCIEAKLPPYFSILADTLEDVNGENKFSKGACDCYELRTLGTVDFSSLEKLYEHEGKLLASISSGKNGGAFTVQPKYKLNTKTNNYEINCWLVLDCHGGPHKILKSLEELYNFLEFGKKGHHLFIRYTDPESFKQNVLTKKYYLVDINEKYQLTDSLLLQNN